MHELLLYNFNLMKKPLFERAMVYKKFVKQFQNIEKKKKKKKNSKIQILKLLKDQKILKN